MRGDSIRDFYAKSFALLGLSVLAGTGALVDYWPSGIETPAVPPVLRRPSLAVAFPVPDLTASVATATAWSHAVRAAARPVDAVQIDPLPVFVPGDISVLTALSEARPLAAPRFEAFAVTPAASIDARELPLEPMLLASATMSERMAAPVAMNNDDGFLTGAFKHTGSSIKRGGAQTVALVGGAVRGLVGVVLKAWPN